MMQREANPRVTKQCEVCGESFRTRNVDRKYCGDECKTKAKNARAYERQKADAGGMNHD